MSDLTPTRYGIAVSGSRMTDQQRLATAVEMFATRWGQAPTVVHVPPDKAEAYAACSTLLVLADENVPKDVFHFVHPEGVAA